jgi:hypothetical protein
MHWNRLIGLGIAPCFCIGVQALHKAFAQEHEQIWKPIETNRWIRLVPALDQNAVLTFERRDDGDYFSVTCGA